MCLGRDAGELSFGHCVSSVKRRLPGCSRKLDARVTDRWGEAPLWGRGNTPSLPITEIRMNRRPLSSSAARACLPWTSATDGERNGLDEQGRPHELHSTRKQGGQRMHGACCGVPALHGGGAVKGSGRFSVVTRDDGTKQWAIEGKPLYFFAADQKAGDVNGDGQGGVWHVVKQAAAKASRSGGYGSGYGGGGHTSSGNPSYNYYGN